MRIQLPMRTIDLAEPELALLWDPPGGGGIYVLLRQVRDKYEVLYVGETHSFVERGIGPDHHAWDRCVEHARSPLGIHVATHTMHRSSAAERRALECALIGYFDPPCNRSTIACPIPWR